MRERLNEEIKRRTRVVRIFPNAASCLRVVRALCADTHEGWLEDHRSLNMEFPERTEERTAGRRLTDHSLSPESAIAQLDVHNPIEIPRQSCSPTSERSDFAHPGGVRTSRRLGAAPSWPGRRYPSGRAPMPVATRQAGRPRVCGATPRQSERLCSRVASSRFFPSSVGPVLSSMCRVAQMAPSLGQSRAVQGPSGRALRQHQASFRRQGYHVLPVDGSKVDVSAAWPACSTASR